jgi:acyl-CoA reductase-like NAD-dependent aldehyde dehydrogenase
MTSYQMLIDGRLVSTPEQDPVINPALGEPCATCARATAAHVDEAMAAAARAFPAWSKDLAARRQKLVECAAAIKSRAEAIASVLSQEQGKPIKNAMGEVLGASAWLKYFSALPLEPEILLDDDKKRIQIVRKPLGVAVSITPWNFPVILLTWKLGPALLAGNTVVAKPSPFTPLSSLIVADALREVLPAGVLNVLSGGNELGAQLVAHKTTRKVSFTGSVATGKRIMASAAEDLKRVTLELGGNDPAIVLEDVDPAKVIDDLFWGAFTNSGQVCVAIKRLYVHEKVYQPIVSGLIERARKVRVGNGLDPATQLGPINNRMQLDKLAGLVDDARTNGATVEVGGARPEGKGFFYPPTIVTGAHEGMRLVDEEQFGTALPIVKYSKLDDALAQANRSHFGLGGSVWTSDLARGEALVQELECGTGWVNQHQDLTPIAPFGGAKQSGLGYEGGKWGYQEFTAMQVVNTKKPTGN